MYLTSCVGTFYIVKINLDEDHGAQAPVVFLLLILSLYSFRICCRCCMEAWHS